MGYQESFIPIRHLAEAAGIRDAINKYKLEQDYDYWYYCATKAIVPDPCKRHPFGDTGRLYVCVGGQRSPYTRPGSYFLDELTFGVDDYPKFFEDLDETLVDEAAFSCPNIAELARREMEQHLACVWDS